MMLLALDDFVTANNQWSNGKARLRGNMFALAS